MTYLIAYAVTAAVFLAIDALWLGAIIKNYAVSQLGGLLRPNPDFLIAAVFYLFYAAGIVFFAVKPALDQNSLIIALTYGAIFGFMCYGTYDFTNLATLKGYPWKWAIVDIAWGTFLTSISAAAGYWIMTAFSLNSAS